jgi:hypothetical protein
MPNAAGQGRRGFCTVPCTSLILIKASLRIPQRGMINNTKKSNKGGLYEFLHEATPIRREGDVGVNANYFVASIQHRHLPRSRHPVHRCRRHLRKPRHRRPRASQLPYPMSSFMSLFISIRTHVPNPHTLRSFMKNSVRGFPQRPFNPPNHHMMKSPWSIEPCLARHDDSLPYICIKCYFSTTSLFLLQPQRHKSATAISHPQE